MATGASNGRNGLLTWIAGGAVAVGVVVGTMYYAGMIGPSVSDAPDEPVTSAPVDVQPSSQPDIADTSKPTPNVDDDVQPDATAEATPPTVDDAAQDDAVVAQTEPEPAQPEPAQPEPAMSAPGFDVVRVDPDGNAVIAGTGPVGARVTIFLDGQEQVSTTVDRSGAFVSLLSIAPSATARILSMTAELDGQTRPSDDQIILAPTPVTNPEPVEDVQVAAVEPVDGDEATSSQEPVEVTVETAPSTAPSDPASETVLAQPDAVQADPATASDQPVEAAGVEPVQPTATEEATGDNAETAETASVPPVEDVQTAATDPAQTDEVAPGVVGITENDPVADTQPDVVANTTEPEPSEAEPVPAETVQAEPVESEPAQIELTQTEPAAATDSSQDGAVQVAQAEPAQDQPASEPAALGATPKTPAAQSEPSGPVATPTETAPPQTADTAQSEPQIADSDVAAQPVATNETVEADATASDAATVASTSQPAATEAVDAVAAIQPPPQNEQTEQSQQTATASPGSAAKAVSDDQTPAVSPVQAEPVQPDTADTEVASVATPTTVAPTEEPDTTGGAPSDVVAQADPVIAPDTNVAQATGSPTETLRTETPPTGQTTETAALADPISETPVATPQPPEPPAPAPQDQVNTAVPELAPAPVQPLAPSQPSIQSQPQSPALITILRAGPDGVEVLQSGTSKLQTPDKIALDLISYSEAGEIQLSGRAQVRSVVRVYLDNKPVGDLVTDDTGRWSGEVEGIIPGIYTLRLDELGQAGVVLSRIETPFKRESPDVLRPPQDPNLVATGDTADGGPVPPIRAVTVQRGDTLWAISRARYGDGVLYVRVFEANRSDIRDPDLIYPGQVFALPE